MMTKRMKWVAWGLVGMLASVLIGSGLLLVRLRPYLLARYHGEGANLQRVVLPGAPLRAANLMGSRLWSSNLREARLDGANLSRAELVTADLTGAHLSNADLTGAWFDGADLSGANLAAATLDSVRAKYVKLTNTNLSRTSLLGSDLTGASLQGANLTGARYNSRTRWPAGFDPQRHGAVRIDSRNERKATVPSVPLCGLRISVVRSRRPPRLTLTLLTLTDKLSLS